MKDHWKIRTATLSIALVLLRFTTSAFADDFIPQPEEAMVCEIRSPFKFDGIEKEIMRQGCAKGDLLLIRNLKSGDHWYEEISAHVCDFSRPFKIIHKYNQTAVCYYQGFTRSLRNPKYLK